MTIRADELATVREGRELVASEGLRRHTVVRRLVTWTGGQPGVGTAVPDDLVIAGARVDDLSPALVASSGGTYVLGDLWVSKITPSHPGGGYTAAQLSPPHSAGQLVYVVTDSTGERICSLVDRPIERNFEWVLVLRPKR